MATIRKPRVLLLAEAANPRWRSVPLVGWSHCAAISANVDAHLVTQVRNREAILDEGLVEGEQFTSLDSEAIARPIWSAASLLRGGKGKGWTTIQALSTASNYYFEYLTWRRFSKELRRGRFDIVHRVTPMSPTIPSPMANWCKSIGIPFVLGPLNGGLPWPSEFPFLAKQENEWLSKFRGMHRLMPYHRSTCTDCSAVLTGSRNVFDRWKTLAPERTFYMPENGIDLERFSHVQDRTAKKPLKVLYVGRMVPYKGADLLIESLAPLVVDGKVELTLIGAGPYRSTLVQLIETLNLTGKVHLVDPVPHRQLADFYAKADVLGFPSLRELGGAVVIEAMIQGVVPVVVDYGGPPEFLTRESGFALPLAGRTEIIQQFRRTIAMLANDLELVERMSCAAAREARAKFTWKKKAQDDLSVYNWLLGFGERPSLEPPSRATHAALSRGPCFSRRNGDLVDVGAV